MIRDIPIVVLDACVLHPAGLRRLMMWLAVHDLIRPKWTEQIHDEWMRNALKDRQETGAPNGTSYQCAVGKRDVL